MIRTLSKQDKIILLGNMIDHFDTSIYLFLAPIIAPLFFPHSDPLVQIIIAYSILVTSVVTKLLGTYIFGMIAKISSPSKALSYSLIGVGVTSLTIGMLPSYNIIGFFAPILFVLLRILREVFSAGEDSIAKLYILQNKFGKEAFSKSYLYQISTICGIILASLAATLIHYINIENSWRSLYFFGGVAAIIGYILRKNSSANLTVKLPKLFKFYGIDGIKLLWENKIDLFRIAAVNSVSQLTYVIPFITMNSLIPLVTNIELNSMMLMNNLVLIFDVFAIYFIGKIILRFDPESIMFSAAIILAITIIPIWCFIENSSLIYVSFVRFWIVVWGIVFLCPLNLWCNNQIQGDKKYIITGIGTALGGIVGKITPSICLSIYYLTNSSISVSFYITMILIIAIIVIKNK